MPLIQKNNSILDSKTKEQLFSSYYTEMSPEKFEECLKSKKKEVISIILKIIENKEDFEILLNHPGRLAKLGCTPASAMRGLSQQYFEGLRKKDEVYPQLLVAAAV